MNKNLENWMWRKYEGTFNCYLEQVREDHKKIVIGIIKEIQNWEVCYKLNTLRSCNQMIDALKYAEEFAYKLQEDEKFLNNSIDELSNWFREEENGAAN